MVFFTAKQLYGTTADLTSGFLLWFSVIFAVFSNGNFIQVFGILILNKAHTSQEVRSHFFDDKNLC